MRKQYTIILASFVMMFVLTIAAIAQGRPTGGRAANSICKLNEDGTSKCGNDIPPIRSRSATTGALTATAATTNSTSWWSVCWNWLNGF